MDGIKKYQSLVGELQWAISIGCFDISAAVATLSSFRAAPRAGHLERAKRVVGYLSKMRHAKIPVCTEEPDYSDVVTHQQDWTRSVYGDISKEIPDNAPRPLGKPVTTTTYVDANLMHCLLMGRSVMGTLHFVKQMAIDWYSKKQGTVETAAYGSEFVATRTATEQIIDLRLTLRYLGIPVRSKSYLFGDNESVVKSSTIPHSPLRKRHNLLAFHRVREAIASKMLVFAHLKGAENAADILSKHWGYQQVWPTMRQILFRHSGMEHGAAEVATSGEDGEQS